MSSSSPAQEAAALGMSAKDFAEFNRLAVKMDYFHTRLRAAFTLLHTAATTRTLPPGYSTRTLIQTGLGFCRGLAGHHAIEEEHFFPLLATRMPMFRRADEAGGGRAATELLAQHDIMHEGLEVLEGYLRRCWADEEEFDWGKMEAAMGWGDVLMKHLDAEVEALGAASMRKYWSLAEMKGMPL